MGRKRIDRGMTQKQKEAMNAIIASEDSFYEFLDKKAKENQNILDMAFESMVNEQLISKADNNGK